MADEKKKIEAGKPGTFPTNPTQPRGAENANPMDKPNREPEDDKDEKNPLPGSTVKAKQPEQDQGFVAFNLDLQQLSELYANMRDGNYWSAMRIAVDILHSNFNFDVRAVRGTPSQRANARMAARVPVSKVQITETKEKLEECCNDLEKQQGQQLKTGAKDTPGASLEKGVTKISLPGLIALVRMILGLFQHD